MKIPTLSVIIPFYNEEGNVEDVIKDVKKTLLDAGINHEIVAVDNGSTDRTPEILHTLKGNDVRVVTVKQNIGFGYGIISGLKAAKGMYLGYMWGDNQISPYFMVKVFEKLLKENLDLCKIKRTSRDYGFFRKLESAAYNRLFMMFLFGKISYDVNGSPKVMKRELYENLKLKSLDWFIDTEVLVKTKALGCSIGEIDAVYRKRPKGHSKVKFFVMMEFIKNLINLKLNIEVEFKNSFNRENKDDSRLKR